MHRVLLQFVTGLWVLLFCHSQLALAQGVAGLEYMEASSPLKSGGRVVSRTAPGQGVVTYIEKATGAGVVSTASYPPSIGTGSPAWVGGSKSMIETATPNVVGAPATVAQAESAPTVYPYPGMPPYPGVYPAAGAVGGTVPTLGITPGSSLRRPVWSRPTTTFYPNTGAFGSIPGQVTMAPPAASLPPSLDSGSLPNGGGMPPTSWTPQSYLTPTASRAFQPLIRFQNMPPGTYLGQGIVGQPEAYVDGQPIRNLFRYLLPF